MGDVKLFFLILVGNIIGHAICRVVDNVLDKRRISR